MIRVCGKKIKEIYDYYQEIAKKEIEDNINNPDTTEFSDIEKEAIYNKYKQEANNRVSELKDMKPKRLFKLGLAAASDGWREGYTKQSIEKRSESRRMRNRIARKSRRTNRKK